MPTQENTVALAMQYERLTTVSSTNPIKIFQLLTCNVDSYIHLASGATIIHINDHIYGQRQGPEWTEIAKPVQNQCEGVHISSVAQSCGTDSRPVVPFELNESIKMFTRFFIARSALRGKTFYTGPSQASLVKYKCVVRRRQCFRRLLIRVFSACPRCDRDALHEHTLVRRPSKNGWNCTQSEGDFAVIYRHPRWVS